MAAPGQPDAGSWTVVEVAAGETPEWMTFSAALCAEVERLGGSVTPAEDLADSDRPVAVIGCADGTAALNVAGRHPTVHSIVLVRCELSADAIDLVAESVGVALLTVADPADRDRLAGAIEGHLSSTHEASDVVVAPFDPSVLAPAVAVWLERRARERVAVEAVTITTPDGWELGGDLYLPANATPSPAVVLMHTGRSDRAVFDRLAPMLAHRGVAALALDWRGRGVSTNLGHFVDFTSEEQLTVHHDITASYDYLGSRPDVDDARLGVLGIAHGAGYGTDGALGDPRTRAVGLMTAYHLLDERQRQALEVGDVAVLCVACTPNTASADSLRQIYRTSPNRASRLLEYPEGVLGYQLFDLHPDLEPAISDWFREVLTA